MVAILGFFRTFVHVPIPLVVGEYLPQERLFQMVTNIFCAEILIAFVFRSFRFASGFGLFYFFQGALGFLMSPIVGSFNLYFTFLASSFFLFQNMTYIFQTLGWIRDVTHSFFVCFNSLSFIMSLCAVPWIIEIIWLRFYPKKAASDGKVGA